MCFTPVPPPPDPTVSVPPRERGAGDGAPCDVWLGGAYVGRWADGLGAYAFAGHDESGAPYYQSEEAGYYLYLATDGYWYVNDVFGGTEGYWGSASTATSTSPLDVDVWEVFFDDEWHAQPTVSAICATLAPSPDPTATPVPTETFAPTRERIPVTTVGALETAVESGRATTTS